MVYERVDDLLPQRLGGTPMAIAEQLSLFVVTALTLACTIYGIVQGFSSGHHEHIVMGIVCILTFIQFAMILRLYRQDVLQDRKVIYYGGFTQFLIASCGLMYMASWGVAPLGPIVEAVTRCDARASTGASTCYVNQKDSMSTCLNLGGNLHQNWNTENKTCKVFQNTTENFGFQDLNTGFAKGEVSVTQALAILTRCHLVRDGSWANCTVNPRPPAPTPRQRRDIHASLKKSPPAPTPYK